MGAKFHKNTINFVVLSLHFTPDVSIDHAFTCHASLALLFTSRNFEATWPFFPKNSGPASYSGLIYGLEKGMQG